MLKCTRKLVLWLIVYVAISPAAGILIYVNGVAFTIVSSIRWCV